MTRSVDHVAHERRRGRAQDRERHAAPDARLDVAGALATRLEVLDDDRGQPNWTAPRVMLYGLTRYSEKESIWSPWPPLASWLFVAMLRVAPPETRLEMLVPPSRSRSFGPEARCSMLERVLGVVGDHEVVPLLLPPAERRDAVGVAMEDAGLPGRGHRGRQRLPAAELVGAVAQPGREERHVAGAQGVADDRLRQAVDLEDDEAGAWPVVGVAARRGRNSAASCGRTTRPRRAR